MKLNRRSFLNSGLLVAGIPLVGTAATSDYASAQVDPEFNPFYFPNNVTPKGNQNFFISHRGVHLKQRIAGENTLESLRLAKRVGFQCVEFDVRFTKDKKAVVIHDETINRTLRRLNGSELSTPVLVKDLTFDQIRTEYVVFTENKKAKTIVPTFEEYLNACNQYKVIPFIEIKEEGIAKEQYDYLIQLLDTIIGRQNYIITSNNKVNDKLRQYNYRDIMVMGILYQTTFEHIQSWKNSILAISATRFTAEEMNKHVLKANQQNLLTESHADNIIHYNTIIKNGIDFISTDSLMPEGTTEGQIIEIIDLDNKDYTYFKTDGNISEGQIHLKTGHTLEINLSKYKELFLYGATVEIEFVGHLNYVVKDKNVALKSAVKEYLRYPVLLHQEEFKLKLSAVEASTLSALIVKITKF